MTQVTQESLSKILSTCIRAKVPTLTLGAPGIGKTDIHSQTAAQLDHTFKVFYPSLHEPTDISGMPIPVDNKKLVRILDDYLSDIFTAKEPTLLLLDEVGQASPAMQAACAPLLHAGRVGNHVLPDCVSVAMASNRRIDRAGASPILTHIISRCGWVGEMTCSFEAWVKWAIENKISADIVSFLKYRPELLHKYDPEKCYAETSPQPDPRKWAKLSKQLMVGIDRSVEHDHIAGCVGEGVAAEFIVHLTTNRKIPDLDDLMRNPETIRFPEKGSARYAMALGIAYRCNDENAPAVLGIAERMHQKKMGEFGMALVRSALMTHKRLHLHPAWKTFCHSPLGQAIRHV